MGIDTRDSMKEFEYDAPDGNTALIEIRVGF